MSPEAIGSDTAMLHAIIADEIRANGALSIAEFMATCLTHPDFGYYTTRDAIGATGDFTTAPEISQIFGELVGIWVAATWQQLGSPDTIRLIELGPGRGTMMRDVLRACRVVPGLRNRVSVCLVEISPRLRHAQRETLVADADGIDWFDTLADAALADPACPTLMLANEFFDALPVTQHVFTQDGWRERCVTLDDTGALTFGVLPGPAASPQLASDASLQVGDICETRRPALCPGDESIQSTFARLAASRPAALLAIDYGHEGPALGDTLQAVATHRHADVLQAPGMQDITAHVDFAELAAVLGDAGMTVEARLSQADFLGALGFQARLARLLDGKSAAQANAIEAAAHRLVAAPGMGSRFRVLGARSWAGSPLVPFPSPIDRTG